MNTETKSNPIEFVVRYETATNYTDESQWISDVGNAYELYQSSGWNLVNVLSKGISDLRSRADKSVLYQRVHEQYPSLSVKRMQNLVSLARKPYAKQAQDLGLEIAHVEAVLGVSDDEAEALLLEAAEQSLSANAIGGIIRERKQAMQPVPVVGNERVSAVVAPNHATDDDPPFARTQGNVLYDDLDATAERLAGSASAYNFSDDDDTDAYTYTGAEFHSLLQRATHRLRDNAAVWEEQRTLGEWLSLVATQAY